MPISRVLKNIQHSYFSALLSCPTVYNYVLIEKELVHNFFYYIIMMKLCMLISFKITIINIFFLLSRVRSRGKNMQISFMFGHWYLSFISLYLLFLMILKEALKNMSVHTYLFFVFQYIEYYNHISDAQHKRKLFIIPFRCDMCVYTFRIEIGQVTI